MSAAGLTFADVLAKAGIAPTDVNVMLHSPSPPEFARLMPSLVRTRRRAVEVFQACHGPGTEAALSQGRPLVASFVKAGDEKVDGRRRMLFIGLYRNEGHRQRGYADIVADPDIAWLRDRFRYFGEIADTAPGRQWTWFDLALDERLSDLRGRLLILARLTPNYVRRAENLDAPVAAIHEQGAFDAPPPPWREMRPSAAFVQEMPAGWAAALGAWRGIYLITDEADGARYVGSAYGAENLFGRWHAHVAGEWGITAELSRRRTRGFRFSILERVSPDMSAEEVIALEQTWMDRLHTRRFGLNAAGPSRADEGLAGHGAAD